MEESESVTAASSSRTWSCRCPWTFQTIGNQTWRGRLPWGRCSHAAVASALMFSWFKGKLVSCVCFLLKAEKAKAGLIQTGFVSAWPVLVLFIQSSPADWRTQMALRTVLSKSRRSGWWFYTWANVKVFQNISLWQIMSKKDFLWQKRDLFYNLVKSV